MNNRNTPGEAFFIRGTQTYEAPEDDDPVPGSLESHKPILLAFDGSSPEGQRLVREFMEREAGGTVPKTGTQTQVQQKGTFGRPIPGAGLAGAALALGEMQSQYYFGSRLWRLHNDLESRGITIDVENQSELQALSNYSENLGGTSFVTRTFFPPMTEEHAVLQLQSELAEARKVRARTANDIITTSPKLENSIANNVRVDTTNKDEWPCVVGPYKYVDSICPGETHHIIPDMVYRLGTAPASEAEKNSTDNRIPNSPTYNQGQAICLSPGMHRTDDDAIHKSINPALKTLGQGYQPTGTAPLGEIRNKTHLAIDQVSELPTKCKDMAKQAADEQVAGKRHQPGRTTMMPPKLPRDKKVIEVLKAGQYPGGKP